MNRPPIHSLSPLLPILLAVAALSLSPRTHAEDTEPLAEKTLTQLSDTSFGTLGQKALSIHPGEWKHSETANFVYHFSSLSIAQAVASEAEFYYRVIAKELGKDTSQWERKSHIFIFEGEGDWQQFQSAGGIEKWSGGIHAQGQLFIQRNPKVKFKGNSLAHEVTHLVVHRFYQGGIPLWLDEGLAEYTASRWYASYWHARGFSAHPRSLSINPENFIPLNELTSLASYPQEDAQVLTFYAEAERLVRFLSAKDKSGFLKFMDGMAQGNRFDTALEKGFGSTFFNVAALETDFKPYAGKDYVENAN